MGNTKKFMIKLTLTFILFISIILFFTAWDYQNNNTNDNTNEYYQTQFNTYLGIMIVDNKYVFIIDDTELILSDTKLYLSDFTHYRTHNIYREINDQRGILYVKVY